MLITLYYLLFVDCLTILTACPKAYYTCFNYSISLLGRALVAAWARYRWGVMEERGYLGHTKYPLIQDNTPTACTTQTPPNQSGDDSELVKLQSENLNANTSLMYTINSSHVSLILIKHHHHYIIILILKYNLKY